MRRTPSVFRRDFDRPVPQPTFSPVIPPPPLPANPVVPIQIRSLHELRRQPIEAFPQFFTVAPFAVPPVPANPVVPILIRQLSELNTEPLKSVPFFFPMIPYVAPPPAANPVVPIIMGSWPYRERPGDLDPSIYNTQRPRYGPVIPFFEEYYIYEAPIVRFDAAQYSGMSFYFEAILASGDGNEVKIRLYNITDGTEVGSVSTTSTTPVRVRSGALALTGAKEYRAEVRRTYNTSTVVKAARLVVEL